MNWTETGEWDDGLGIYIPTAKELDEFVRISGYTGSEPLPLLTPRRKTATVKDAAAQLMFTQGSAQSLPVVVAALRALAAPDFNLPGILATTGNVAVCAVYSGPKHEDYGLFAGGNTFGPRAGQNPSVGRAIALFLQNVCGATSTCLDMSTIGQPGKFGWCGAETAVAGAEGWEVEEIPAVTMHAVSGMIEIAYDDDYDAELLVSHLVDVLVPITHLTRKDSEPPRSPAVVVAPEHARVVAAAGYGRHELGRKLREGCLEEGGFGACKTRVYVMGGVGRKSLCLLPWSGGSLASSSPVVSGPKQ